jgi:hypothetical protein
MSPGKDHRGEPGPLDVAAQEYRNAGGGIYGIRNAINSLNPFYAFLNNSRETLRAANRGDPEGYGSHFVDAVMAGAAIKGAAKLLPPSEPSPLGGSLVPLPAGAPAPAIAVPVPGVRVSEVAPTVAALGVLSTGSGGQPKPRSPLKEKQREERKREAEKVLTPDEFEDKVQAKFGGKKERLPVTKARPGGTMDVEVDLVDKQTLTQVKRVVSPKATFGPDNLEQFQATVDAALTNKNITTIRYVVATEAPQPYVDAISKLPMPKGLQLAIERMPATK